MAGSRQGSTQPFCECARYLFFPPFLFLKPSWLNPLPTNHQHQISTMNIPAQKPSHLLNAVSSIHRHYQKFNWGFCASFECWTL